MYMVVSRWEVLPGHENEVEGRGSAVRQVLRSQPEIKLMESFRTDDGGMVAVIGYESKEAYDRIINDPSGPFQKALSEQGLENHTRWVRSERGESMED